MPVALFGLSSTTELMPCLNGHDNLLMELALADPAVVVDSFVSNVLPDLYPQRKQLACLITPCPSCHPVIIIYRSPCWLCGQDACTQILNANAKTRDVSVQRVRKTPAVQCAVAVANRTCALSRPIFRGDANSPTPTLTFFAHAAVLLLLLLLCIPVLFICFISCCTVGGSLSIGFFLQHRGLTEIHACVSFPSCSSPQL